MGDRGTLTRLIHMRQTLLRRSLFLLERWVQQGVIHQFLLMASLVALVAVCGGVMAWALTSRFDSVGHGVWWAFLRLTDPGYLGDDEGVTLRVISTTVTVLGYVLFMGSLIAIMTQWLTKTVRRLESGVTPIFMRKHVVILGWTNRTPEIIRTMLGARGRLDRFLVAHGIRHLRIVVLADHVDSELRQQLRDELREVWGAGRVFLRSGSSLRRAHLERLALDRAAIVVIPGADFELGGADMTDTRVVKTLLSLDSMLGERERDGGPHLVAEIFDPHKVGIASSTVRSNIDVVPSDQVVSRLIYQTIRNDAAGACLLGIISGDSGARLFIRSAPELAGCAFGSLVDAYPKAVPVGVVFPAGAGVHGFDAALDRVLAPNDSIAFLASAYADCQATAAVHDQGAETLVVSERPAPARLTKRVMVLGWSYKVPSLLEELAADRDCRYEVTIMSKVPIAEREHRLASRRLSADRLPVRHIEGDYASESDLRETRPAAFDSIIFLASGWMSSGSEADARTVLGCVLLETILRGVTKRPSLLVEFLDPDNAPLFASRDGLTLLSPLVLSHLLAHVALRPELNVVFSTFLGASGAQLIACEPAALGLTGKTVTFPEIQHAVQCTGAAALGVLQGAATELNPSRGKQFTLSADDRVIVLDAGHDAGEEGPR